LALAWIHLALCWVAVLLTLVVGVVRIAHRRAPDWRAAAGGGAGLLAGGALRPNPMGGAGLAYVQVVELLRAKRAHVPLAFGVELAPFGLWNFVDQLIPVTALAVAALGYLVWLMARRRYRSLGPTLQVAAWSSAIL